MSGVPKGSVLVPLQFLICINEVSSLSLTLFADNLLHREIKVPEGYIRVQFTMDEVSNWFSNNYMCLTQLNVRTW